MDVGIPGCGGLVPQAEEPVAVPDDKRPRRDSDAASDVTETDEQFPMYQNMVIHDVEIGVSQKFRAIETRLMATAEQIHEYWMQLFGEDARFDKESYRVMVNLFDYWIVTNWPLPVTWTKLTKFLMRECGLGPMQSFWNFCVRTCSMLSFLTTARGANR